MSVPPNITKVENSTVVIYHWETKEANSILVGRVSTREANREASRLRSKPQSPQSSSGVDARVPRLKSTESEVQEESTSERAPALGERSRENFAFLLLPLLHTGPQSMDGSPP